MFILERAGRGHLCHRSKLSNLDFEEPAHLAEFDNASCIKPSLRISQHETGERMTLIDYHVARSLSVPMMLCNLWVITNSVASDPSLGQRKNWIDVSGSSMTKVAVNKFCSDGTSCRENHWFTVRGAHMIR